MDYYASEEWFAQKSGHPGGAEATAWMLQTANIQKNSRILDFACGRGDDILCFRQHGCMVIGIDASYEAIQIAKKRYAQDADVELICGNAWEKRLSKNHVDGILCQCSLSLLGEERMAALVKFREILRPGGALLLADLCCVEEEKPLNSRAKWEADLKEANFSLEAWKDVTKVFQEYCMRYLWETGHPFPACAHGACEEITLEKLGYFLSVWR